jgi:hypothetical protein
MHSETKNDIMLIFPIQEIKKQSKNDVNSLDKSDETLSEKYNAGLSSSDREDGPICQSIMS